MKDIHTVRSALTPLCYLGKLVGVAPVTRRGAGYELSWLWCAYSYTLLVLLAASSLLKLQFSPQLFSSQVFDEQALTFAAHRCLSLATDLAFILLALAYRWRRTDSVLQQLQALDDDFIHQRASLYRSTFVLLRKQIVCLLSVTLTSFTIFMFVVERPPDEHFVTRLNAFFVNCMYHTLNWALLLEFTTLLFLLKQRLVYLLGEVVTILDTFQETQAAHQLHRLIAIYDRLSDIARLINSKFQLQILVTFALYLAAMIVRFSVAMNLRSAENLNAHSNVSFFGIYLSLVMLMRLVFILYFCNSICDKTEALKSQLAKIDILARLEGDASKQVHRFLTQTEIHSMNFTVYGYFSMNNGTLVSLVSIVLTYIVVMVDFLNQR